MTVESDCDRTHRETYLVRARSADEAWMLALDDDDNVMSGWIPVGVERVH